MVRDTMKPIQKMIVVMLGMVIAVWMMAYWDPRQANIVCDISQHPSEVCQRQPFIDADRAKSVILNQKKLEQ
jgi:hypothetical protein